MTVFLKQSTASQEVVLGRFLDSTDGNTEKTGLTIANTDIKIWVTGATTVASKNSGGGTHIANGIYYCVLDATDTATLGPLEVHTHVSSALATKLTCCVLAANVYDSLIGGGADLTVALSTQGKADVKTQVTDGLNVDTYAEPGQGAPGATISLAAKINYLFKAWRNKKTQTSTTFSLFADDTTTVDQKASISDDGTTFTSNEVASGP